MGLHATLRTFRRHWILLGTGVLLALALFIKVGMGGGPARGLATTQVLLDTPDQQLVDRASAGVETLGWRAAVLSQMMGSQPAERRIAGGVPVPPDQLAVVAPELNLPSVPASLPFAAAAAAAATPEPYVLTIRSDGILPLVDIRAQAPDRSQAARLAEAAVREFESGGGLGPAPESPRFDVTQIAQVRTRSIGGDPALLRASVAGGAVLCIWGLGILLIPAVLDWLRRPGPGRVAEL